MKKSKKVVQDLIMEKIGARIQVSFESNAGNDFIRIKERIGGRVSERIVHNLSGQNLKYYKVLGVADGQNFMHCLYLGSKYAKNFDRCVAGYRIESSDKNGCVIKVTFYQQKKRV